MVLLLDPSWGLAEFPFEGILNAFSFCSFSQNSDFRRLEGFFLSTLGFEGIVVQESFMQDSKNFAETFYRSFTLDFFLIVLRELWRINSCRNRTHTTEANCQFIRALRLRSFMVYIHVFANVIAQLFPFPEWRKAVLAFQPPNYIGEQSGQSCWVWKFLPRVSVARHHPAQQDLEACRSTHGFP